MVKCLWTICRWHVVRERRAVVAQLVEHLHGKEKVSGSNPDNGSIALNAISGGIDGTRR